MGRVVKELLRFCDFLALALHTENLELLRRVVKEFHATPRTFATVQTLLATGFPAVSILPVAHETQRSRELLTRQDSTGSAVATTTALCEIYDALVENIQLSNWYWLLRMYEDFCNGVDTTVQDFVARRSPAIAMFPIAPIADTSMDGTESIEDEVDEETTMDASPLSRDETFDITSPAQKRMAVTTTASSLSMDETSDEEDVADVVRRAQRRVERKAPWERIYDVATIAYPFDSDKYPALAQGLLTFWEQHARAVWERNFWSPLSETNDVPGSPYNVRKTRQREASIAFTTTVILPIFAALGVQFFMDLDAQEREIYWWWYRRPVVDLVKVALAVGVNGCVRYTTTQARKRVPTLPTQFQVRTRGARHDSPVSMWSTMVKAQHIAKEIDALRKASTKTSKRRFGWE